MFAGSCIGVILLVMSLELLRRLGKEYDRYILREYQQAYRSPLLYAQHNMDGTAGSKDISSSGSHETGRLTVVP